MLSGAAPNDIPPHRSTPAGRQRRRNGRCAQRRPKHRELAQYEHEERTADGAAVVHANHFETADHPQIQTDGTGYSTQRARRGDQKILGLKMLHDGAPRGAERAAYADLLAPLRDPVAGQSNDAERGHYQKGSTYGD